METRPCTGAAVLPTRQLQALVPWRNRSRAARAVRRPAAASRTLAAARTCPACNLSPPLRPVRLREPLHCYLRSTNTPVLVNMAWPSTTMSPAQHHHPALLPGSPRAMFSTDQSFPLAASFAYSVYRFQQKRVKRDPEGPYFGGNPIVGAILTTVITLGMACGVGAAGTRGWGREREGSDKEQQGRAGCVANLTATLSLACGVASR